MKEYIERNDLIKNLNYFAPEHYNALINQLIIKQPTADVREVIHAKWTKATNDKVYWYICSHCGCDVPRNIWNQDWFSDWCPNCGSRMYIDEVEEVL